MRWSIQELFRMLSWQWTGWWWRRLVQSPKNIYRNIKTTIHWIFTGYTHESLWNLDHWLDEVILFRLKKFATYDRMGYPSGGDINTDEEWQAALDTMVEGFQEILDETYSEEQSQFVEDRLKEGLSFDEWETPTEIFDRQQVAYEKSQDKKDLFWKHYGNLWD